MGIFVSWLHLCVPLCLGLLLGLGVPIPSVWATDEPVKCTDEELKDFLKLYTEDKPATLLLHAVIRNKPKIVEILVNAYVSRVISHAQADRSTNKKYAIKPFLDILPELNNQNSQEDLAQFLSRLGIHGGYGSEVTTQSSLAGLETAIEKLSISECDPSKNANSSAKNEQPSNTPSDLRLKISKQFINANKEPCLLIVAIKFGYVDLVNTLIRLGADVNAVHDGGKTPLKYAVMYSQERVLATLLSHKADPLVRDDHGNTLLHIAAKYDNPSDSESNSSGHVKKEEASSPIIKYLLDNTKLDIDKVNNKKYTALAMAAYYDNIGAIKTLMGNGAYYAKGKKLFPFKWSISTRNSPRKSCPPLFVAAFMRQLRASTVLIEETERQSRKNRPNREYEGSPLLFWATLTNSTDEIQEDSVAASPQHRISGDQNAENTYPPVATNDQVRTINTNDHNQALIMEKFLKVFPKVEVDQELIEFFPEKKTSKNRTYPQYAAIHNNWETVQAMMARYNVNQLSIRGGTLLETIIVEDLSTDYLISLLFNPIFCEVNVNKKNYQHQSPLSIALEKANENKEDGIITAKWKTKIKLLVLGGAIITKKLDELQALFHDDKNMLKVLSFLSDDTLSESPEFYLRKGVKPLHIAAIHDRVDILDYLITQGVDINQETIRGETALLKGIAKNSTDAVRFLLEKNITTSGLNQKNKTNKTIFQLATEKGNAAILDMLLTHELNKSNQDDTDSFGNDAPKVLNTLIDIARMMQHRGIIHLFCGLTIDVMPYRKKKREKMNTVIETLQKHQANDDSALTSTIPAVK